MDLHKANISLEEKSWFFQENFLKSDLCQLISNYYLNQAEQESFLKARIGNGNNMHENTSIRKGSFKWIDYLDSSSCLIHLNSIFSEIMLSTSNYFRLSLKRFESQFAVYNPGDFYNIHLDQHINNRHRLISCCLYLNEYSDGGELVIYEKGSKTKIDTIIKPMKGSLVLFFSADIYHEVKTVNYPRHSVTTWFRDDEDTFSH